MADAARNDTRSSDDLLREARRLRSRQTFDESARGEAGHRLAVAMDSAYYSGLRFTHRVAILGDHGEDLYGLRWQKVERIVTSHDAQAIDQARRAALAAGWSEQELRAAGLAA